MVRDRRVGRPNVRADPQQIDDGEVKALLPNKAVLTIKRRDARTRAVTWTPPTAESNFGIAARPAEPLHGELAAAE